MRLYRFIDTDKKIDTVVVTDGSCDQKRVFITEIRGIVAPGDVSITEDEVSGSDALLKLGFPWKVGESVMHEELVAFAKNKELTLELNPQGLNEVVAVTYVLETKEPTLNFPAKGGDDMCVVTSSKQTFKNGKPVGHPEGVPVEFSISGAGFKVDGGGQVTVDENPNNTTRKAVVTVKQNESGKTLQITCNQAASTVTYEYALTVDPIAVTFDGAGGEKPVTVTSTRTKVLNGVKQQPEIYPTDIELAGVGFDYEESGNNYNLKASENTGSSQRTGKATISQDGGKTAEVTLTQDAAIVIYDYALSADSQTLQFAARGETKSLQIVSTRQKKVNDKPSGGVEKVDTTARITGTGFSQTSSETSNGENYSIVAAENKAETDNNGSITITQTESNKTVNVTLTQLAATVTKVLRNIQ